MATSPNLKVYRNGKYVASCKHAEDAAALVGISGGEIRYRHKHVVWPDTEEARQIAAESYDEAASIIYLRVAKIEPPAMRIK